MSTSSTPAMRASFDFLVWGVVQTGSWGNLEQRAGAFVGEVGWQAPVRIVKPWVSAGYSYGAEMGTPMTHVTALSFKFCHSTPVRPLPFLQHDEQRGLVRHAECGASFEAQPPQRSAYAAAGECIRFVVFPAVGQFQPQTYWIHRTSEQRQPRLGNVWDVSADTNSATFFQRQLFIMGMLGQGGNFRHISEKIRTGSLFSLRPIFIF